MRIAVLTNAYPPDARGGAGQIAALQVDALRARGHEVRVWHVPLRWTRYSLPLRLAYHFYDLIKIDPCVTEIIAWKPERLLTHNLTGIGFRTPSHIQKQQIAWAHLLHDVQLFEPSGRLRSWQPVTLWQRFWSVLRRVVIGIPDDCISPTETLLRAHEQRGFFLHTRTHVIPNPAPAQNIPVHTSHQPTRIIFVGRWTEDKGAPLIEKLWQSRKLASVEWHLIGPGTEKVSPPQGTGYGSLSVPEILALFAEMDLLLVPSQIMENQPTVLLEAMSRGLPVIASRQEGIVETLGSAGVVCDSLDETAWEREIALFLSEDEQARFRRREGMRKAGERYHAESVIQRLEAVLVTLN